MASRRGVAGRDPAVRAAITRDRIDVAALYETVGSVSDGAVNIFIGRVRDAHEGRRVTALTYEAYEEMAEPLLRGILEEVGREHDVSEIVAVHRTGDLELGDIAVAIAVAAPHRDAAYAASRAVIEEIKKKLPVWKLETYADGVPEWK